MEIKKLAINLLKIPSSIYEIERILLYIFCLKTNCNYKESEFMSEYFTNIEVEIVEIVENLLIKYKFMYNIYTLIELLELLIPLDEGKENGMVYTPTQIKNYILKSTITFEDVPTICDPACGCGSFLLSAAEYLNKEYDLSYNEIFSKYIFGVDIIDHNINKCKLLFHLLALTCGEQIKDEFNLATGNSLALDWSKTFPNMPSKGFNCVIGNPPYVRSKNLSIVVKESLQLWETSTFGNVDLYIPFYELGLNLLNSNGKLGYISPNTFLQSVNGKKLRAFFKEYKYELHILDFRETQVFKNVTSYTCITLINKSEPSELINYALLNGESSLEDFVFTTYNFNLFKDDSPWRMVKKEIDENIKKIECIGIKLDDYKIRNGLATLKNSVFFFMPKSEDRHYYYREYNSVEYKIEKEICIDVAKPNIIKSEKELQEKMEKAIFPYEVDSSKFIVFEESMFKSQFPYAYSFLCEMRNDLDGRDKGNGKYPAWYAYGRTQGMNNTGKKLLLPYITGEPKAVLSLDPQVLFYCGYAVFSEDEIELCLLKKFLESNVFWYYISNTSKPYAKGYMSLAKNYIKNFGIPILSEEEKIVLLSLSDKNEINNFINDLYKLDL